MNLRNHRHGTRFWLELGHVAVLFESVGQRGAGHSRRGLRCLWQTGLGLASA